MIISQQRVKINCAENVATYINSLYKKEDQISQEVEHFWVISLTSNNTIKFTELIGLGTINQAVVEPREIFRRAIINGAASIIVVHNHPSGNTTPSSEDRRLTSKIKDTAEIIGIKFLDHIIIGDGFYSFADDGQI